MSQGVWHDNDPFLLSSHRRQAYAYILLSWLAKMLWRLHMREIFSYTMKNNNVFAQIKKISRKKEYHKHYIYLIPPPNFFFHQGRWKTDAQSVRVIVLVKTVETAWTKATLKLLYYSQKWSFKYISYKTGCHFWVF